MISHLEHDERFPVVSHMLRQDGVQSLCVLPLTTAQRRVGAMGLGSVEASAYDAADLEFLRQVAAQVAVAVDNALTPKMPKFTSKNWHASATACACCWK